MKAHTAPAATAIVLAILAAGCAPDGTLATLNTSSITPAEETAAMKADPACVTLASQIDALNEERIPEKLAKAAKKKYKMKAADIAKADALNKAHSEFQTKCSSYPPAPIVAEAEAPAKVAAKPKPPVPAPKPVAAAMVPQSQTQPPATQMPAAIAQQPFGQQPFVQP